MRKRIIAVGVLAGGIALTGLAGSAYAAGASPATSSAPATAKAKGPIAIVCVGEKAGGKAGGKTDAGKPGKVIIGGEAGKRVKHEARVELPGKPLGKPGKIVQPRKAPPGALVTKATVDGKGTVKIGPLPKGVHCSKVMPGTKGAPPLPPAR
jgi:hypothetical protein